MSQVFLSEVLRAWSEAGNEASGLHAWKMSIYRLQLSKSLCSSTTGSWKSCLFSAAHQSMGWALLGPDLLSSGLGPRGSVQGVRTDVRGQSRWPFFHPWKSVKQTTYCRAAPFVWCHCHMLSVMKQAWWHKQSFISDSHERNKGSCCTDLWLHCQRLYIQVTFWAVQWYKHSIHHHRCS